MHKKFSDLRLPEKERFILALCVGDAVARSVLDGSAGEIVEEQDINPTEINSGVFNEKVCPQLVKYLFSSTAWNRFYSFFENKKKVLKYQCSFCLSADSS